tara:strand:+ start:54 stop:788 length:735 start_codon:yes stop_codon:yes gene_type:complete
MRYFLTFLFFIVSSNVYATDPDSLPDDPWMKNFFENCGYYPIKHHENNNVFWRFTLEKGDRGGCSSDNIERSGALYWERKEVGGRKLKSDATYEVQFKVRFDRGFEGDWETFLQLHGYSDPACSKPLLMFKFGGSSAWLDPSLALISRHTGERRLVKQPFQLEKFSIDEILGIWQKLKFVFETNAGKSKYSLYINNRLEVSEEEFYIPACSTPHIKFGIYRLGDPEYGKTSIVDFDDVIVTKVR